MAASESDCCCGGTADDTRPEVLIPCGKGLWLLKGWFHLGEGQSSGLTYSGLRARLLGLLDAKPWVLDAAADGQESTKEELAEEAEAVERLRAGEPAPFVLDTTMAIVLASTGVTDGDGAPCLVLISPAPATAAAQAAIRDIALASGLEPDRAVGCVVAPNLQHWLFAEQWTALFPAATVMGAPSAMGESLQDKMPDQEVLPLVDASAAVGCEKRFFHSICDELEGCLLEGAPQAMNEIVHFHGPTRTLIAADAAYTGYAAGAPAEQQPSWFGRLWFKLTKPAGSFRRPELPVYRTHRVVQTGSAAAVRESVDRMCRRWAPAERLAGAHASVPFVPDDGGDAMPAFKAMWELGLDAAEEAVGAPSG
ncbi:hypothetical protein FNF27_05854 [Cafeteria roenbergensis]|uniref:Uncharacterized protein n=1 Tax=Cafeteria roenbergensis TaxID=33653 RepID=A0A5A8E9F8_CAFRO|nr:hypothetical protein FNF27_05854 [Cafeteria roenbergensis]